MLLPCHHIFSLRSPCLMLLFAMKDGQVHTIIPHNSFSLTTKFEPCSIVTLISNSSIHGNLIDFRFTCSIWKCYTHTQQRLQTVISHCVLITFCSKTRNFICQFKLLCEGNQPGIHTYGDCYLETDLSSLFETQEQPYVYVLFSRLLECDHICENPPCSEFYEIIVSCIFDISKTDRVLHLGAGALCSQLRCTHDKQEITV